MKPISILSRDGGISAKVETITPKQAESYLANGEKNRSLNMRVAQSYAYAMQRGQWQIGQPLTFDHRGKLIDGQHRLRAVVLSGQPCDFLVVRGLHRDSFSVFDIGRKRGASDILEILGFQNYVVLSAVARAVLMFESRQVTHLGTNAGSVVTVEDVVNRAKNDGVMRNCAEIISGQYREAARLMRSSGMAGAFLYVLISIDADDAHDFFGALCAKTIDNTENPAWLLKMRLADNLGRKQLHAQEVSGLTAKAWNAFHGKRPIVQLKYRLFSESPPKIIGYPYPNQE